MIIVPFVAAVLGFLVAYQGKFYLSPDWAPYLSLAAVAGLDTIFGGIRSGVEGKFHQDVFISGFFANSLLAAFLAWLGDRIGVDLYLAAAVVLGGRIFLNLSLIRRYYLNQVTIARQQRR